MTCPISNKLSVQQKKKCYKKKLSYKNVWEEYILGFSVKIQILACFVLLVRNGEGPLHVQKVAGGQGELLTGTMLQNSWNSRVDLNETKTHQSLREWLGM